jgi:predicted nucleic acid-binding protein
MAEQKPRRCYLDANVLIAAWRGDELSRAWARTVLDDPQRRLVVSNFVRLEVLPKPGFYKRSSELAFMLAILDSAEDVPVNLDLIQSALALAARYDLSPLDALHLAAAAQADVDELLTLERPEKPICRQTEVPVISLYALAQQS